MKNMLFLLCIFIAYGIFSYDNNKIVKEVIIPYALQIISSYEGESVCFNRLSDEENANILEDKRTKTERMKEARKSCKCMHMIANKYGIENFDKFTSEYNLEKEWDDIHSKIMAEFFVSCN